MTELFFKILHSSEVNRLSKIDSTFGIILRKKRLSKKLTQEALSIESSLSRAYISELEMGKKDPSLFTIFKLADALKVKPSFFIEEI